MTGGRQKRDIQVQQGAVQFPQQSTMANQFRSAFIAKVTEAFSQRMTCNLKTNDGQILHNVPVMTKAGLVDGKPYGTVSLPAIGDYVVVIYAAYGAMHKIILGTIVPYMAQEFSNRPINSDNKEYTTTMLESDKPLEDKTIFKSGTTVMVEENGTVCVETPKGSSIRMDEEGNKIVIDDLQGNTVSMTPSGIVVEDKNGNTITMASTKIVINGKLEVSQ